MTTATATAMALAMAMAMAKAMAMPIARATVLVIAAVTVLSALAAPAGAAVKPVPRLPTPARLPAGEPQPAAAPAERAVPAWGGLARGQWLIGSGLGLPLAQTHVSTTPVDGIALLADWDGDGLATPGRFNAGQWDVTSGLLGAQPWRRIGVFGTAGDTPVTGDLDGDGKADLGVFADGRWRWRMATGGAGPDETFGVPGDRPLVGDWNGDGRDDIGVWRGGTWILRVFNVRGARVPYVGPGVTITPIPQARAAYLSFAFGSAADAPVVGDWNGDGRSDPGYVRGGRTWVLSAGLKRLARTRTAQFAVARGATALVASNPNGRTGCPTARGDAVQRAAPLAASVAPPLRLKGTVRIPGMREVRDTAQDGLRYVYVNDVATRLAGQVGMPFYDVLATAKTQEEAIRRSANIAQSAAIMATTSRWRSVNGLSRAQLVALARWHIRSIACQHAANSPGGWGNSFQSALWATSTGQAAWMLWPELSAAERSYVSAMVAAEADDVVDRGPLYFRDREGRELTPGDSRADENSWNLLAPALALSMFRNDDRGGAWRATLVSLGIVAFARPSDLKSTAVFNGVAIGRALAGTNANEDGTVTNHGIVNPDYTQNVEHLWWAASLLRSARVEVPAALFLNADIVYRALAVVQFPSPPYAAPGGTVYKPLGVIYYPMGISWGVRRPATFTGVDGFANIYAAPDAKAGEFLAAHARDARALQLRFTDGHMYLPGNAEDSYRLGKEEYALQQMSLAWWSGAIDVGPSMTVSNAAVPGATLQPR